MTGVAQSICVDGGGIAGMERRLDRMLRNRIPEEEFVALLQSALLEWSSAIVSAAESLGRSTGPSGDLERGLELAQRPVFVCGTARSGTTLLRDLLDGHPEVIAIPHETGFYRGAERALFRLRPERHVNFLGRRWVERLAAHPPFWLLGPSTPGGSPYVRFARDYDYWCRLPETRSEARSGSWPLAAYALAFGLRLGDGRLPPRARLWLEKTPGNERFLARIWQDFPLAKVIHIVRRPEAVLASVKRMAPRRWDNRRRLTHILGEMAPSYWIAAGGDGRLPAERYCVVKYEDLTGSPERTMSRIAAFLEIEPLPSLLRPTVAGRPASSNTSFAMTRPPIREVLGPADRVLLALAIGRQAARLGYAAGAPSIESRPSVIGQPA